MNGKAVAISREKLEDTLVTWDSITTADGAVGCTSLIDAGLIGKNDFVTNQVTVLILGGNSNLEKQVAATFNSGTGTITFTAMSHRILSGTPYRLINFGAVSVGAIQATILSDATPFPGADIALIQAKTTNLPASPAASGEATAALAAVAYTRQAGVAQVKATTIDLNQAATSYTLFTGTGQVVDLEKLVIQMPTGVPAGALTGISIQTDDATPQPLITTNNGLLVNLTSEGQLTWIGICRIRVGKHIQMTIIGGATGVSYVCSVDAQYRAVITGGTLS